MNPEKKFSGLTGAHLKWIALITMFLQHAAIVLIIPILREYYEVVVLTHPLDPFEHMPIEYKRWELVYDIAGYISRISFPIYCFLLIEGMKHTRNQKKYVLLLGLMALISEIPYDMAFENFLIEFTSQNVFFTLFIGALVIYCIQRAKETKPENDILPFLYMMIGITVAAYLNTDYGGPGLILICVLYLFQESRLKLCIAGTVTTLLLYTQFTYGIVTPLAFLLIWFYNGERGKQLPKWFFYGFYPVHLFVLFGFRFLLLYSLS